MQQPCIHAGDVLKRSLFGRAALTLIETLVAIGIVVLLVAIVVPAVQRVRESARRAACRSNLRQIGLALQQYESAFGMYPPSYQMTHYWGPPLLRVPKLYSVQTQLLPFLDRRDVFNLINFDLRLLRQVDPQYEGNTTAAAQRIAVFLCPSDGRELPDPAADNSYRTNMGSGPVWFDTGLLDTAKDGAFHVFRMLRRSEISDGLANTAAFSERLRGDGDKTTFSFMGDSFYVPPPYPPISTGHFADLCVQWYPRMQKHFSDGGTTWLISGRFYTWYDHHEVPNSPVPDCSTVSFATGLGSFPPRSYHPGGVNVLMLDGSVHFISDGIDFQTWRALGTRAGGESVEGETF